MRSAIAMILPICTFINYLFFPFVMLLTLCFLSNGDGYILKLFSICL